MSPHIDIDAWYSPREAEALLDGAVKEETLKGYCRRELVEGKQVGPKKEWRIRGKSILDLRKKWELDP